MSSTPTEPYDTAGPTPEPRQYDAHLAAVLRQASVQEHLVQGYLGKVLDDLFGQIRTAPAADVASHRDAYNIIEGLRNDLRDYADNAAQAQQAAEAEAKRIALAEAKGVGILDS